MRAEHGLEAALACRGLRRLAVAVADGGDRSLEGGERRSRDDLPVDGESGAAGRGHEVIDAIESLPTLLLPLRGLGRIQRELPPVLNVGEELVAQLAGGRGQDQIPVEVSVDCVL